MSEQEPTLTIGIEEGLDFILGHFLLCSDVNIPLSEEKTIWPRTISTKATEGRQILVNSKEDALARFSQSKYEDCRVSAYPPNALDGTAVQKFQGLHAVTPANLIVMIDLDKCNFRTDRGFNVALTRVLGNIKEKLNATPTILWSGRGYHIILPLTSNGIILENVKEYEGVNNISLRFLRYAELFLSLKKSDPVHNKTVSFNNCMLRIPGSINSKNGETVKVIQKWDKFRPEINYLLSGFTRYIINEKYQELLQKKKQHQKRANYQSINTPVEISWIEYLLKTPIRDHRKYCIWRILVPYLLNIRKLSEQETTDIVKDWLIRCDQLKRLDFNSNGRIREDLRTTEDYLPISYYNLGSENYDLHQLIGSGMKKSH
jgi:hypothetical protein